MFTKPLLALRASNQSDPNQHHHLHLSAQLVNLFGIEDQVVCLEKPADSCFVQFHFEAADADGAVTDLVAVIDGFVAR